jgi:hypothetical protein
LRWLHGPQAATVLVHVFRPPREQGHPVQWAEVSVENEYGVHRISPPRQVGAGAAKGGRTLVFASARRRSTS